MKKITLFVENFKLSLNSIKTNTLRTILTVLIIAVGIMALVGILTAIDSLKSSISSSFSDMGANTFTIQSYGSNFQIMGNRVRKKSYSYISYKQATEFKEKFTIPANVSVATWITGTATISAGAEKTNPNVSVEGSDEGFLITNGVEIGEGRMFSDFELETASNVAIIGNDVKDKLFKNKHSAIDEFISFRGIRYRVIGVFNPKGSSFGGGVDMRVVIPISNARSQFSTANQTFYINITPTDPDDAELALSEAEGIFRQIRRLSPSDESDFNIEQSDAIAKMMLDMMSAATAAAIVIGFITLLGASIGLMNIMLVAVTERTREIGTRKAIGATASTIKQQFLFEAVVIGQLGGILGIILGIGIGNIVPALIGGVFVIPWFWMMLGVIVCFLVSIGSGYIPAVRAAKLDPIESLRYE